MTTYQDILDYLTKNYDRGYRLFSNEPEVGLYTFTNEGYNSIIIFRDSYSTSLSLIIDSKLSHLLADLLDTPVDKRVKPKIKHSVDPVSKENLELHDTPILDTNDKIINRINSFILSDWSADRDRTLILVSSFIDRELEEVFKLFKDFDFTIEGSHDYINGFGAPCGWVYILGIEYK